MKKHDKFCSIFLIALITIFCGVVSAMAGNLIRSNDGRPYHGYANFKFTILSGSTSIWSNDGTSTVGNEPLSSVRRRVENGIYSIDLGSNSMKPFFSDLLDIFPEAKLITWVDTGTGFRRIDDRTLRKETVHVLSNDFWQQINHAGKVSPVDKVTKKKFIATLKRSDKVIKAKIASKQEKIDKKIEKARNPGERALERFRERADINGSIPMDALIKAKQHIDEIWLRRGPPQEDAGIWTWEWLGPGNIGGRIRTIVIHPTNTDHMWIGSVSGGIWTTTNGGASWQPVDDFMANLNVTSIVMDPTNSNVMYAGTGEGFDNFDALPGAGIFRSTDGGVRWTLLASTNNDDFRWVNRLAHHPTQANRLFAATKWDIWESTDGGGRWNSILRSAIPITDIKIHPTSTDRILVGTKCININGTTNYGKVYYSDDGGGSWDQEVAASQLPSDGCRYEVAFSSSEPDVMYVSVERNSGEIWRSIDGAATWSLRNTGVKYLGTQGWYNNAIWVDPTDSDFVIVGGIDLWRSTDGGASLSKISDWSEYHEGNSAHADHHAIVHHPNYNGTTNRMVYFGNDGGIQMTSNVGTVDDTSGWTNLANGLGITQFYGGAAAPDGSVIVGGTQDNDKLRYIPFWGANDWFQSTTGDGGYSAIDYNDPDYIWGEHPYLDIKLSTNRGNLYFNAKAGLFDAGNKDRARFIAPFSMDPNDPKVLVAGGRSIWRVSSWWQSEFGPAPQWNLIRGIQSGDPLCSAIDIAPGGSQRIWVGYTDGHVARTANGGYNWVRVDNTATPLPNSRVVTDIAINPENSDEVFVTFSGYNNDNVWLTTDNGNTWTQRNGTAPDILPALQVNTVTYHRSNPNWVYIGTDLGIFASEDKGINWSVTPRYSSNEGPVNVEVSELFWQGEEYLIAATHGRGMFRSRPLDVIYVSGTSPWPGGSGSFLYPFHTVTEALNAAGHGSTIRINGGTYGEAPLTFYKRGTITATNNPVVINDSE